MDTPRWANNGEMRQVSVAPERFESDWTPK